MIAAKLNVISLIGIRTHVPTVDKWIAVQLNIMAVTELVPLSQGSPTQCLNQLDYYINIMAATELSKRSPTQCLNQLNYLPAVHGKSSYIKKTSR